MSSADATSGSDSVSSSPGNPAELDLSRYRSTELVENLTELICVPRSLVLVLLTATVVGFLVVVTCGLVFYLSQVTAMRALVGCAYALFAGMVLGFLLGLLRIASSALKNIETILRLLLETVRDVAADYQRYSSGAAVMPPAHELVERVYEGVLLPAIEEVVEGVFGILARPVLACYRWTIGGAVKTVLKRTDRRWLSAERQTQVKLKAMQGLESLSRNAPGIAVYLEFAAELVSGIGRRLRRYAIWPMYAMFLILMACASIPIVIICRLPS